MDTSGSKDFNLFPAWEDAIWRPRMTLHSTGTQRVNIAMNSTSPQPFSHTYVKIPKFPGREKVKCINTSYLAKVFLTGQST